MHPYRAKSIIRQSTLTGSLAYLKKFLTKTSCLNVTKCMLPVAVVGPSGGNACTSGLRMTSCLPVSGRATRLSGLSCGGGNVTSAGWQVTLCDPMWHVSSRLANCYTVVTYDRFSSLGGRDQQKDRQTDRQTETTLRR